MAPAPSTRSTVQSPNFSIMLNRPVRALPQMSAMSPKSARSVSAVTGFAMTFAKRLMS